MLIKQGMATAMVRRTAHTTGSAASGVNIIEHSADTGVGVHQDHNGRRNV
jgi:hypothetical protein